MTFIRKGYVPIAIAENNDEWNELVRSQTYISTDEDCRAKLYEKLGEYPDSLICCAYFCSGTDKGIYESHGSAFPSPLLAGFPLAGYAGSDILMVINDDPDHYIPIGNIGNDYVRRITANDNNLYDCSDGTKAVNKAFISAISNGDTINSYADGAIVIAKKTNDVFDNYGTLYWYRGDRYGVIQANYGSDNDLLAIMNGYNPLDPEQIEETVLVPVLWNSSYKPEKYQAFARLKRLISL